MLCMLNLESVNVFLMQYGYDKSEYQGISDTEPFTDF